MTNIVDLATAREAKRNAAKTYNEESLTQLIEDLKSTVSRMEVLGKELIETQKKLVIAEKRAQWAQQSINNLRGLCVQYIKSECSLRDGIKNRETT